MKNKDKLLEKINNTNKNSLGTLGKWLSSQEPSLKKEIDDYCEKIGISDEKILEKIYCYLYEYNPFCDKNNKRSFISFSKGYYTGCKKLCPCAREKQEQTMKEKYGVKYALQSSEISDKLKEKWKNTYNTSKLHEINLDKKHKTNIQKYGVKHPLNSSIIRQKASETLKNNYNVEFPFQSKEIQNNIQNKWLELTGKRSNIRVKINTEEILKNLENSKYEILYKEELLKEELSKKTRQELAFYIGCSISLIDKKIQEFNLTDGSYKNYYENAISNFLDDLGVSYEKNTRKIIPPKELDFYIPNYNLAIEFNGLHWHGERLGKKQRNYHKEKTINCKDKNIHLVHIFQDEWDNKSDIIKSIIKQHLHMNTKIFARKCELLKISNKECNKFLETNHLYEPLKGCFVNYGLYYNNELVSVMNFKHKSSNTAELARFCNKKDLTIVGGPSKLFKTFLKEYSYEKIISFIEARYFKGTFCENLGFEYVYHTKPNYYYFIKSNKKYHRSNFMKQKLVNEGNDILLSEWEIMYNKGWDRIWDSGHYKFIYRKNNE